MQLESIFSFCQGFALVGWSALILAPFARGHLVNAARLVSALLCLAYLIQLFTITQPSGGNFSSLAGVTALFAAPGNVMLGWTHYLAFDLFIGSWEVEDAGREGVTHWLIIPILILTLMFGPIGLLVYLLIRTANRVRRRQPLI
jgi:Domain of unknown function (DUF4281)